MHFRYPASYTGVVSSMPMMGDLTTLGEAVFNSLYQRISERVQATQVNCYFSTVLA